jgi:catechol 2,3-dioxygenase-like lactoylglutathione lyase family enzyme
VSDRFDAGVTMIDHLSIGTSDLQRSREFYDAVLTTLGYRRVNDLPTSCGYGPDRNHDDFYIVHTGAGQALAPPAAAHVAFVAPDRAAVVAFHQAALAAGAVDDGAPGLRPQYHASYFAAYVLDLDGNRIEAVCHRSE